ncbi:GtrA family protein [Oceanobacillus sp. APA_J-5(13-2)]|nr:GtrA family protein [Oceanobacillus alkalisoli]MCF3944057.1 GtrA family protein [Oceanobacillus alkalisoli]MCG5103329.1 GtrA family protein [Oceanobacillus alkalisoli]
MEKLHTQKEFLRFALVGICNTINYYILYLFFLELANIHYFISHWVATLISMVISYFLNVYFTYKTKPSWKSFFMFPLTQVVNMIVQAIFLAVFVEFIGISSVIAPFIAIILTVPITFVITRRVLN